MLGDLVVVKISEAPSERRQQMLAWQKGFHDRFRLSRLLTTITQQLEILVILIK